MRHGEVMEDAGSDAAQPRRVNVTDLMAAEGLPSDKYNNAVNRLSQSLAKYNCAVIQLAPGDEVLVKCVLESARMFFHQRPIPHAAGSQGSDEPEWNGSSGYYVKPHSACEAYDFRPGHASDAQRTGDHYPPVGLPELFTLLGKVSRQVLDAIGRSLDLRSFCFAELLDNVPLKPGEVSASVLSVCCHGRPRVHGGHHRGPANGSSSDTSLYSSDTQSGRGLLTLMKSDKPGLQVRDEQGRWIVADMDLGPGDMVVYCGLALYQCTAGYISPGLHHHCIEVPTSPNDMHARCSVSYRLMPRPLAVLQCSAMVAAGHEVLGPFQQSIPVSDFMQCTFTADHSAIKNTPALSNYGHQPCDGGTKAAKYQKQSLRVKPLAPSKRLRLEAQRVLKEKVQEIADSKGIKIRFCSLKDCEEQHIPRLESPCSGMRAELGWPAGVPFVHPHDLPNKAKQAFLLAYEPGLTISQTEDMASGDFHLPTHVCEFLHLNLYSVKNDQSSFLVHYADQYQLV